MVTFKLDKLLEKNNKTKYWLAKQINVSNNALANIYNNESKQIRTDTIDKICKALECKIEDLIEFTED